MPQIAVPVAVPEADLNIPSLTADKKIHVVGGLITISFSYLFRNGEYTKPRKIKRNGRLFHSTRIYQL